MPDALMHFPAKLECQIPIILSTGKVEKSLIDTYFIIFLIGPSPRFKILDAPFTVSILFIFQVS